MQHDDPDGDPTPVSGPALSVVVWGVPDPSVAALADGREAVEVVRADRDAADPDASDPDAADPDAADPDAADPDAVDPDVPPAWWRGYEAARGRSVLFLGEASTTVEHLDAVLALADDAKVVVSLVDDGRTDVPLPTRRAALALARASRTGARTRDLLRVVAGPVGWTVRSRVLLEPRAGGGPDRGLSDQDAWVSAWRGVDRAAVAAPTAFRIRVPRTAADPAEDVRARVARLRSSVVENCDTRAHLHASHLRDLLAAHPELRPAVVADLEDLPDVPWGVINERLGRDLVVSYLFPPSVETSGLVMARRIREAGRPVDVIAGEVPSDVRRDPSGWRVAAGYVARTITIPGPRLPVREWEPIEQFCAQGARAVRRAEIEQGPYRTVYSRSMPPASHALAALLKIREPERRWVAEFSDPLVLNTTGRRRTERVPDSPLARELRRALSERGLARPPRAAMLAHVELLVFALADEIVFTNEIQRELMLRSVDDASLRERVLARAVVAAHPTPDAALYRLVPSAYPLDAARVNIAYFGAFFRARGFDDVAPVLLGLTQAERREVCLHVFTDRVEQVTAAVDEAGLSGCVNVNGYLPYLEFLAAARRFDLLVVSDSRVTELHGVNPYLPSKLSDYLGAGVPVWALVEEGSPTDRTDGLLRTRLGDTDAGVALLRDVTAAVDRTR